MQNILRLITTPVHAQQPPQLSEASNLLDRVLQITLPLAGLIALAFFVWGGYMWIISEGDPAKIKSAQGTLTWAILGLVFIALIRLILTAVFDFIAF
jgi:hypothetical protein